MTEMNSYERVLATLNGKKSQVDHLACANSVGTYTKPFMQAFDAFWPDSNRQAEKMARLAAAAHRTAGLDVITLPFDMVVEAEVLGAPVDFHEGQIRWPSVKRFTVKEPSDLKIPVDYVSRGRIPVVKQAIKLLKEEFGSKVPINVFVAPPFTSVSSYLIDTVTFYLWTKTAPEKVKALLDSVLDFYAGVAREYVEAGADMLTFHEMGASCDNISPQAFDQFAKPYLTKIIGQLKVPTVLNICGSADRIGGKMVETGASAVSIDEKTPIRKMREAVDQVKPGFPVIGNLSPRDVIHFGPKEKIEQAVKTAIDSGVDIVAPGCDFWIETPTEHIKYLVEATAGFGAGK